MEELASEVTNPSYGDDWIVPTRWHIDDVKAAIQRSDFKDSQMPSDEELHDYLYNIVTNGYFIEIVNEAIADQLYELFEEPTYPL